MFVFVCVFFFLLRRQVSTSGVAEEDQAPDTGGAADDQACRQHDAVRHPPAQPAHEDEAQDDLHPAQAVHQAVGQLAEAKEALRQRSHHGLVVGGRGERMTGRGGRFLSALQARPHSDEKSCTLTPLV